MNNLDLTSLEELQNISIGEFLWSFGGCGRVEEDSERKG